MSFNLQNSINLVQEFVEYAPMNAGFGQEPATSTASMIRATILNAPTGTWHFNRVEAFFPLEQGQQDYVLPWLDFGFAEDASVKDSQGNIFEIDDLYNNQALAVSSFQQRPTAMSIQGFGIAEGTRHNLVTVDITSNVATIVMDSVGGWVVGDTIIMSVSAGPTFMDGVSLTILTISGNTITASFTHANYPAGSGNIVQRVTKFANTATTTFNVTFPNPVTAGNTVLLAIFLNDPNGPVEGVFIANPTDNLSVSADNWGGTLGGLTTESSLFAYWKKVAGGATTYNFGMQTTAGGAISPSKYCVCAMEISGTANSGSLDPFDDFYDIKNQTGTSQPPNTNTLFTSGNNIIIGVVATENSTSSIPFSPAAGITLLNETDDSGLYNQLGVFGKISAFSGSQAYPLSTTVGSVTYGVAAFSIAMTGTPSFGGGGSDAATGTAVASGLILRYLGVPEKSYTASVSYQKKAQPMGPYPITGCASASGGNTAYSGTFDPLSFPTGKTAQITGFKTNLGNNGAFTVVSCTSTTLTVSNGAGVAETISAYVSNFDWSPLPSWFSDVYNNLFLAEMLAALDDPRSEAYRIRGVSAFMAKATGLTEMQRNAFAQQWASRANEVLSQLQRQAAANKDKGV